MERTRKEKLMRLQIVTVSGWETPTAVLVGAVLYVSPCCREAAMSLFGPGSRGLDDTTQLGWLLSRGLATQPYAIG